MGEAILKRVEAVNNYQNFISMLRTQVTDKEGMGGKLDSNDKATIQQHIKDAEKWMEEMARLLRLRTLRSIFRSFRLPSLPSLLRCTTLVELAVLAQMSLLTTTTSSNSRIDSLD